VTVAARRAAPERQRLAQLALAPDDPPAHDAVERRRGSGRLYRIVVRLGREQGVERRAHGVCGRRAVLRALGEQLHDQLVERGIRDDTEIRIVAPMGAPVPVTPAVSQRFLDELEARGIEYTGKSLVVEIDPAGKEAVLESGERLPYDLFIGIPIHRVPAVVAESGLAENGWVAVDRDTLLTPFPDVYAVGDVVALPMAKAGVFAENAGGLVADHIAARLRGETLERRYEGEGNCYIEFGGGRVAKVQANFLGGPSPQAEVVGPSEALAAEKGTFAPTRRARWFGG
jgi:sulfide:quinone oxidoreductase